MPINALVHTKIDGSIQETATAVLATMGLTVADAAMCDCYLRASPTTYRLFPTPKPWRRPDAAIFRQ